MDFEQPSLRREFCNQGRPRSDGRRRRHDGFWLWQTVYGPEPAEAPLPGTVKSMVSGSDQGAAAHQHRSEIAYGSRCAISHLPAPRLPDVAHIIMDAEEQPCGVP